MGFSIARVTIGATAGLLADPNTVTRVYGSGSATDDVATSVVIRNAAAASIYLGPTSGVTTGTGFELITLASISLQLAPGDEVWAIAAGAGNVVHTLKQS